MVWLVVYTVPVLSTATPPGAKRKLRPLNGITCCPPACVPGPPGSLLSGPLSTNATTAAITKRTAAAAAPMINGLRDLRCGGGGTGGGGGGAVERGGPP